MRRLVIITIVFAVVAVAAPAFAARPGWIVSCQHSHDSSDDPIVFPGIDEASHLHTFVGATTTDEHSTPESLRAGDTTCLVEADHAAYWMPAVFEDSEQVALGTGKHALFYYRRVAAGSSDVVPFPDGLKIVVGNPEATSPLEAPLLGNRIIFKCGPGATTDLPVPPTQCDSGIMVVSVTFPNCWDGSNLDSADHISHMAYPVGNSCPDTHPVVLPRVENFFRFDVGADPIDMEFSSGPFYTVHADFLAAWEPAGLQALLDGCMNAGVDCGKNPSL